MILVTGATGKIGSEAVRLLAARGHATRALVRDPSRAPSGEVEIVTGDFDRPDTLDTAMRGIVTVLLVSPGEVPAQEIAVIDAAVRHGVAHIVKVTNNASAHSPIDRRRAQATIEAHLKPAGVAYTLLRSNAFMQNILGFGPMVKQTRGFVMSVGDGRLGMIDARDVAATAVAVAIAPTKRAGRTYWLTGPELVTYADVARELSETLGYAVEYRQITPDEHRAAMIEAGVPEAVATTTTQVARLIGEGDSEWLSDDVASILGTSPRSLRTFITDHRAAFI